MVKKEVERLEALERLDDEWKVRYQCLQNVAGDMETLITEHSNERERMRTSGGNL